MVFNSSYSHLNIPDQWNEYFSKYPNGYTILEAVINWAGQVNDMTDTLNSTTDYVNSFMATFDTDLNATTKSILEQWQADGTLSTIITQALQTDIGDITQLKTTDKTDMTHAVNEIVGVLQSMAIDATNMTGATDTDKIQNAINLAQTLGNGVVLVPYKASGWSITKALQLPSNTVLLINNATLKLAAGVMDNIIVNSGARTNPLTANQNIHIVGIGHAVVDGQADINKNFPGLAANTQYYNDYHRIGINLFNTQGFSIRNITVREPQGWGISLENGCRNGLVRDIKFDMSNAVINQDGLDIRRGCSDIIVENITGTTGDDMVALTTLNYVDTFGNTFQVGGNGNYGLDNNIKNIKIRNIKGYTKGRNNNVRLLCKDANQISNIEIDGVEDQSPSGLTKATVVIVGSPNYATTADDVLGDMSDIKIRNVQGYQNVDIVNFQSNVLNVELENIRYFGNQMVALLQFGTAGKTYKNIRAKKLVAQATTDPTSTSANPAVIYSNNAILEDIFIQDIKANNVRYIMASNGGDTNTIKNLRIRDVYLDGTALQAFRMGANLFNQYNPSFITNVRVKDLTRIYMAPLSGTDFAGQVFLLNSYIYVERFVDKVLDVTKGGISLYNLGEGTKMIITPPVGTNGWTAVTSSLTVEKINDTYKAHLVGDFTVASSTLGPTNYTVTNLNPALTVPNSARKSNFAYGGTTFYHALAIVGTDKVVGIRSLNGSSYAGITECFLDIELEVNIA